MRRRTSKPVTPARPAPAPAAACAPRWKLWLGLITLAVLAGIGGWGAWSWLRPDPFRDVYTALDRRDFRTASDLLAKHLEKTPDDHKARLLAAQTARRGEEFVRAQAFLREYERKSGTDAAFVLERRLLQTQRGDIAEADRLYAEFIATPSGTDAPLVAEAYLEGKLRALAPLGGGRADPDTEEAALAATEANAPNLARAIDVWLASRPGRADQVQGRLWRARVAFALNKHADGLAALREALTLDPDHVEVRFQLAEGVSLIAPDEAVRHLELLRERHPKDRRVCYTLATAYRTIGRGLDARRLLEAMLKDNPKELSALVELGHLNLDEGNVAVAESLLKTAHELAPNVPETNLALARCMQLAGKPDEAAKYRKRFDEIDATRHRPSPKK